MNQVATDPSDAVKHIQQGELLNGSERRMVLNVFNKCSEECSCISLKRIKKTDVGIYRMSSGHESKRKKVAKLRLKNENKQ